MKTAKQILQVRDAYMRPVAEAAADAGDAETLGVVQRLYDPAFDTTAALLAAREAIETDANLTPAGKIAARQKLAAKFKTTADELLPKLTEATADVQREIEAAIYAADAEMVPERNGSGWLRKKPTTDPAQIALDGEARAYWRSLDARTFTGMYREWVEANDPRARVAEADPAGVLVSGRDREWARQYRVEHSPLKPRIDVLRAKARTYNLLLETLRMELTEAAAEVEHA